MKKWQKILVIVIGVIFVLGIFKNSLIKGTITTVGSKIIGAKIEIKKFSLGIITSKVSIKGLKVHNPEGFPAETMVDIPEITVDLDSLALLKGKIHLPLIVVNLKSVTLITNKEGVLNVNALKIAKEKEDTKTEAAKGKKSSKKINFQIDLMKLNIEEVIVKDFSKGEQPTIEAIDVGLKNKEFKNITSPEQFAAIIISAALGKTALKGAGIYGAMTVLGAAFLPVGAAAIVLSDDDVQQFFQLPLEKVYQTVLKVSTDNGEVKSQDPGKGVIKAKLSGADVTIEISDAKQQGVSVKVSARKFMLPKPKIAGGVMHSIEEALK